MRLPLSRVLIAGVAATASVVAAMSAFARADAPAANEVEGRERYWRWNGHEIFTVEAGSGPLVLLVHGIYAGSSSFEYRRLLPLLARQYRTVAIDLLGCGNSDKPKMRYDGELFVRQIIDAVEAFGPDACALVGSSLGAAFAIRAAARLGERVRSLVAISPTGLAGVLDGEPSPAQAAIQRLIMTPVIGQAAFNLLASRPSIRWFLVNQAYADPVFATPHVLDHYWTLTHQPGARYVPAHFVGGALNTPVSDALGELRVPALIVWGECARDPSPVSDAERYLARAQHATLATLPKSKLLPHEEEPAATAAQIERFLAGVCVP